MKISTSSLLLLVGASWVSCTHVESDTRLTKRADASIADVLASASSLNNAVAFDVCSVSYQAFAAVAALGGAVKTLAGCEALGFPSSSSSSSTAVTAQSSAATSDACSVGTYSSTGKQPCVVCAKGYLAPAGSTTCQRGYNMLVVEITSGDFFYVQSNSNRFKLLSYVNSLSTALNIYSPSSFSSTTPISLVAENASGRPSIGLMGGGQAPFNNKTSSASLVGSASSNTTGYFYLENDHSDLFGTSSGLSEVNIWTVGSPVKLPYPSYYTGEVFPLSAQVIGDNGIVYTPAFYFIYAIPNQVFAAVQGPNAITENNLQLYLVKMDT